MEPKFIRFKVETYNAVAIYEYNQFIRKLIYQFKGCYDYVLGDVFLDYYYRELKLRYYDYYIIPIPSYENDDEERGFNHVVETFKRIGSKTLIILKKIEKHKQAKSNLKERREVYKSLAIKSNVDLTNRKVLIVDDVYTTGSTMKSAINLIEKLNPKTIKVLVIAKTKHKQRTNTNKFVLDKNTRGCYYI